MPNEDDSIILQIGVEGKDQFKKDLEEIIKSSSTIEEVFNKIGSNTAFKDLNKEVKVGIIEGFSDALKEVETDLKKTGQSTDKVVTAMKQMGQVVTQVDTQTKQNTKTLSALEIVTNGLTEGTLSFRTANKLLLEELKKLALQGKQNTKEYDALKKKAGELADTISDVNNEVKTSGSDTRGLDKALRATTVLVGGFTALQGAAALFVGENKELEKTLIKVNGAMALLQGLQSIQEEFLKKDSLFTDLAAKAKGLYARATLAASQATLAFKIALGGLLLAGFIAIVYGLVKAYDVLTGATNALEFQTKALKKVREEAAENSAKEIAQLNLLQIAIDDENISREQKVTLIHEAVKANPEYLKGISDEAFLTGQASDAIAKQIKLIQLRATARAAEDLIVEKTKEILKKSLADVSIGQVIKLGFNAIFKGIGGAVTDEASKSFLEINALTKIFTDSLAEINKSGQLLNATKETGAHIGKHTGTAVGQGIVGGIEEFMITGSKNGLTRAFTILSENLKEQELRLKLSTSGGTTRAMGTEEFPTLVDRLFGTRKQNETEKDFRIRIMTETITEIQGVQASLSGFTNQLFDNQFARLEDQRRKGLINEKQYAKEVAKIRRKQAIEAKAEAAFNITINIAQAITKALTTGPIIGQILAGLTAALGFAQLAAVLATPIPTFRTGGSVAERFKGSGFVKGKSHEQGGVPAELEGNEFVHKGAAVKKYGVKFMEEINNLKYNPLNPTVLIPDIESPYGSELRELLEKFDTMEEAFTEIARHIKNGNRDRIDGTTRLLGKFGNKASRYV